MDTKFRLYIIFLNLHSLKFHSYLNTKITTKFFKINIIRNYIIDKITIDKMYNFMFVLIEKKKKTLSNLFEI